MYRKPRTSINFELQLSVTFESVVLKKLFEKFSNRFLVFSLKKLTNKSSNEEFC